MTKDGQEIQKVLTTMDFDSMQDEEEEKSYQTSNVSDGYVSFPRPKKLGGHVGGMGIESANGGHVVTSNVHVAYISSFDPYAPPTTESLRSIGNSLDVKIEKDELLAFDTNTATSEAAATPAASSSSRSLSRIPAPNSLFDDDDSTAAMSVELPVYKKEQLLVDSDIAQTRATSSLIPGVARYLEMEEEPPREPPRDIYSSNLNAEPIRTDSGLLLTHRKHPGANYHRQNQHHHQSHHLHHQHSKTAFRNTQQDYFEAENRFFNANPSKEYFHNHMSSGGGYGSPGKHSMVMLHARRLMSFVKIWMVVFAVVLLFMTGALFHSFGHKETLTNTERKIATSSSINVLMPESTLDSAEEILLLPLYDISQSTGNHNYHHRRQQKQQYQSIQLEPLHNPASVLGPRRILRDIRHEFEGWMIEHNKSYHSEKEKEKRFHIWSDNHQRTIEKNDKHGPCKLTKQHVFGSNHFKDLTPEEFQAKYLTGYKGAYTDDLERRRLELPEEILQLRKDSGIVLNHNIHKVQFHESVKQRMLMHNHQEVSPDAMGGSRPNCKWYDISCFLRWIWSATGIQFGALVGTMEPKYDKNAYPNGVDWRRVEVVTHTPFDRDVSRDTHFFSSACLCCHFPRDFGAITGVRTQGECGACWAVTAVETVEAAHFLATGTLYELSESEIIACDDSCQMCDGKVFVLDEFRQDDGIVTG
jgi:hypothetical protein